jgi:two-component system, OmpR family, response regulator MprA
MYEKPSAEHDLEVIKRVLVVDDDKGIRDLLQMALESEGYQVAAAADGATAIEFLTSAEDAWIVLLDIMMPGMDGLEVCVRLCGAGPRAARHRVALMTAGRPQLRDYPPPARMVLSKPFRLHTLHDLVAALAHNQAGCEDWQEQPQKPFAGEQHS